MKNGTAYPSPEAVKEQLQLLLNHEEFKRSPILTRFLEHVVLTKLGGREEEIKEYTIATNVLKRPSDFNPQLDATVRIHAGRLRNILLRYYYTGGVNAPIVISIPKGTYVPVFEINDKNLQHPVSIRAEMILNEKHAPLFKQVHKNPVLAVLSFHDLSPEPSNDGFLTALSEQLSTELAKFDNLSVISFYATQRMDAVADHFRDLRNEGVDYVITGSLRFFNGTMKINVQLTSVDNGNILWSESFLRHQITNENAFDVQDEVTSIIANIIADDPKMMGNLIKARQLGNLSGGSVVLEAIGNYFDYTYDYNSTKFEATFKAVENAYKIEEENVLIVSILSKLYLDLYACAAHRNEGILEKGIELAKKAVSLDTRSQFAQKALAWAMALTGDKNKAEEAIDHCMEINPTAASSLSTLGLGLIMMGDFEKGHTMLKRSVKLHHNPYTCAKLGFSLYYYQNKNFTESSRWLNLLPPFDVPFSRLLKIAVDGNLKGKAVDASKSVSEIQGQEQDIVGRIVLDPKLRAEIFDGWKRAGFVCKENTEAAQRCEVIGEKPVMIRA
jgi:TolB-like protein